LSQIAIPEEYWTAKRSTQVGRTHIVLLPRGVDSFMIGFGVLPEPAAGLVPSGWSGSAICRGFYFANFALIVARPAS
jgi:hypothetical protein